MKYLKLLRDLESMPAERRRLVHNYHAVVEATRKMCERERDRNSGSDPGRNQKSQNKKITF
jgi:hypothetical protein